MAEIVFVPKADWKAALDATREKGGTSALLTSSQLAPAIEAIPTGGGGQELADSILDGSFAGEFHSNVTVIQEHAFDGSGITEANFPNLTVINDYVFDSCTQLTSVNFPSVERVGRAGLRSVAVETIVLPKCEEIRDEGIAWIWALKTLDLPALKKLSRGYSLVGNTHLTALILRAPAVAVLENANALEQTPIAAGTGYIYVPTALVDQYKAAPNWSTYAAQFRAIEDYPTETGG